MRQLKSIISIVFAGMILAGCSSSDEDIKDLPSEQLYSMGQNYLQEEDYNSAIRYLESVDGKFRQGSYREQTELSLMYAYYKTGEYYKALDVAERFARTSPTSPSLDYVYYLAGLSNARLGDNWIQDFFGVNRASRAVKSTRNAYGSFQTLIQKFPESKYVPEAKQWTAYLKNRLAEHELEIVKYYKKRDAYVAMANRVNQMMQYFPDCQATYDALPYLQESYEAMGIKDSAEKTAALIEANKDKQFLKAEKPEYGEQF